MLLLASIALLLQAVIHVHTEVVVVPVTVTDAHGKHVSGLRQDNFRLFVDGRPQPIAAFHHGEVSLTLGLIVDRSQSMRPKTQALLIAVSRLLQSTRPGDELFAVVFNDRVSWALPASRPFTSVHGEIEAGIFANRAEGMTALYDGVAEGMRHLELGHADRHALIVVSDGGDNASSRKYKEILALARQSNTVVYAIGIMGSPPAEEQEDAGLLERLCKDTGGIAYFPRAEAEIALVSAQIAGDLREQYTLGLSPDDLAQARGFHKIEVRATQTGRKHLRLRTRSGYLVP